MSKQPSISSFWLPGITLSPSSVSYVLAAQLSIARAKRQFFPRYRPDERVAVYAMLGGIPAYWEQFKPQASLDANIREQFLGVDHHRFITKEPPISKIRPQN